MLSSIRLKPGVAWPALSWTASGPWTAAQGDSGATLAANWKPPAEKVAALVERELRARGEKVEVLDGYAVRESLSKGLGVSRQDRDANVRRIAFVADALSRNGIHALAAAITPNRETRKEVRASMGNRFVEVHVGKVELGQGILTALVAIAA